MVQIVGENYAWFDPNGEDTFLLYQAKKYVGHSHYVMRSLAKEGRRNPQTGKMVKLRVCRLPGGLGTSVEEYHRWVSAVNRKE